MASISLFWSLELALYFFEDVDFSVQLPPSRDNYICKYKVSNTYGSENVFHEKKIKRELFCVHYTLYYLYVYNFKKRTIHTITFLCGLKFVSSQSSTLTV